jgi:hypothetical protein
MRQAYWGWLPIAVLGSIAISFYAGRSGAQAIERSRLNSILLNRPAVPPAKWPRNSAPEESALTDHARVEEIAAVSFGELWEVMRTTTPERRISWANELLRLPPGTRRNAAVQTFYMAWVDLEPTSAITSLEQIQNEPLRRLAMSAVQGAASESTLPSLAEMELRLGYRATSYYPGAVLSRWATADPPAVAAFLEAHPQTDSGFFYNVTWSWANVDAERAAAWFLKLQLSPSRDPRFPRAEDRRRREAARGLVWGWLDRDRAGAAAFVSGHSDDPDIRETIPEFTESLCARSREEANAFLLSLPNETLQRAALDNLFNRLQRIISIREGGDDEEPADPEITPEDVAPFLVGLPSNLWIDHAGEILQHWDETNTVAAENWLRSLPKDVQSNAIAEFCRRASSEQAQNVVRLTGLLENQQKRDELRWAYLEQVRDDPAQLRVRVDALPLSEKQKQTLLGRVANE